MRGRAACCIVLALALGCSKSKPGGGASAGGAQPTPDAVFKGFMKAMSDGDGELAATFYLSDEQIDAALEPGGDCNPKLELRRARDKTRGMAKEIKAEGGTLEFLRGSGEQKQVTKGAKFEGCTAKMDFTISNYDVEFVQKKGDERKERKTNKMVVKLEGGWYLADD